MAWSLRRFLTKAVPLAISRGTTSVVEHLELRLEHDGVIGRGEAGASTPVIGTSTPMPSRRNSRPCSPTWRD